MFEDRDEAETKLKDAEKNFQAVEEGAGQYPDLLRRARFGLAQVYETLSDVSKARDYYQQVAEADTDSPIGKLAAERLDRLSDPSIEKWYNWFERQEPAPPVPPGGPGLEGPLGDLEDLPETPDLSFPSTDPLDVTPGDELELPAGPTLAPADQPLVPPSETEMPAETKESTVEPGEAWSDTEAGQEQPPGESAEPAESPPVDEAQASGAAEDAATGGDEPETP
jgi:hypothetical protein